MSRLRRPVLLVVLALAVSIAPLTGAQSTPPDASSAAVLITRWLPPDTTARQAGSTWTTSAPLPAADAVLVGADWGGDPRLRVQVRGGSSTRWGQWWDLALPPDDHAPDPGTTEAARVDPTVSDPVWLGRVARLQVRVRAQEPPSELTLHTVALRGGSGTAYLPPELRGGPAAVAAPSEPDIVARESWDPNGQCPPRDAPGYASDVRFTYVHHTAGSNDYGSSEGPAHVLATCMYHRNSRGYDDIAYNALIDRYGNIYEGRAGGLEEPVVGAHAAGFNSGSFGVSVMGNFSSSSAPSAATDALRRLLAWKLDLHHIDPHGTTTEISGGGSTTRYAEDRVVELGTVLGHRDTGLTECPGSELYDYVDGRLRDDVATTGAPKFYGGPRPHEERPVTGERPEWEVLLSSPGPWRLTIADERDRPVRATSGGGDRIDLRWDFRDASGAEVAPGTYTATLDMVGRNETPLVTVFDVRAAVERQQGDERIATAVELSRWAFPDEPRLTDRGWPLSEEVVIASAEVYADALVASPLAGSMSAPVLLTHGDRLHPAVIEEIGRLGATEAYIVGGTARLSERIERDLDESTDVGSVERFAGPTRYHTAGQVAWEIVRAERPDEALLALGDHPVPGRGFPDALAAGAFGAAFDLPVLLVQPDHLPEPAAWVLSNRPSGSGATSGSWADVITVFGGGEAISSSVESAAASAARGARVDRFAGGDRYDTSRLAATELLDRWDEEPDDPNDVSVGLEVVLATGDNWPDALGAGAAAARRGTPLLLVPATTLDHGGAVRDWMTSNAAALVHAVTAGGPAAVSDEVLDEVEAIVRSDGPNTGPREDWGLGGSDGTPASPLPGPTGSPSPSPT